MSKGMKLGKWEREPSSLTLQRETRDVALKRAYEHEQQMPARSTRKPDLDEQERRCR